MKITAQQIHEAYGVAMPDAWNKPWNEISQASLAKYTVMADYLNAQTVQEIQERIERHIADLDRAIAEQHARIRETYDSGIHTNVDPQRAAILEYEQRKLAFEIVLDEMS